MQQTPSPSEHALIGRSARWPGFVVFGQTWTVWVWPPVAQAYAASPQLMTGCTDEDRHVLSFLRPPSSQWYIHGQLVVAWLEH